MMLRRRASRSSTRRWPRARLETRIPIGRRVSFGPPGPFDIEVIGVVRDLRYEHLREAAPDGIFFPLAQIPKPMDERRNVAGATQPINLTSDSAGAAG